MLYNGDKNLKKIPLTHQELTSFCNLSIYQELHIPLYNESGYIFGESGLKTALLNGVIATSNPHTTNDAVKKIATHFKEQNLPYSWWLEASVISPQFHAALENEGLHLIGEFAGMIKELNHILTQASPKELTIEIVSNEKTLQEWSEGVSQCFEFPESVAKGYATLFQKAGYNGSFTHVVGKKNDKVVTTGSILYKDTEAYIYNIGTTAEERKKGYASAILMTLFELAKKRNCTRIALIASPMALKLNQKLGFERVCTYLIYA